MFYFLFKRRNSVWPCAGRFWLALLLLLSLTLGHTTLSYAAKPLPPLRIAIGDVPSVEFINLQIAVERLRQRGITVQLSFMQSEKLAARAVHHNLADVAVGTPYQFVQREKRSLRMFVQLSKLRFHPVVSRNLYPDWQSLDGAEVYAHGPGSGTASLLNIMARRHNIQYAKMHYLPGSAVRAQALLSGRIHATIVDSTRRRLLQERAPERFLFLPLEDVSATDEALYGKLETLKQKRATLAKLVEEILTVWRQTIADPQFISEQATQMGLINQLSVDDQKSLLSHYQDAVATHTFDPNGGDQACVAQDFAFFTAAGTLQGDPAKLRVEDYWYFAPLNQALQSLGRQ
uniref:SsuA/THI5-like domain-containing protein n=1 Tax=Magnetococcus massalia (strain MO-1) TaxID=451514 RepID=A0A1S7LFF9_MAGMO|nr:Conserved exported protein of unknown function [Candidatus Magnetococcus massalia]